MTKVLIYDSAEDHAMDVRSHAIANGPSDIVCDLFLSSGTVGGFIVGVGSLDDAILYAQNNGYSILIRELAGYTPSKYQSASDSGLLIIQGQGSNDYQLYNANPMPDRYIINSSGVNIVSSSYGPDMTMFTRSTVLDDTSQSFVGGFMAGLCAYLLDAGLNMDEVISYIYDICEYDTHNKHLGFGRLDYGRVSIASDGRVYIDGKGFYDITTTSSPFTATLSLIKSAPYYVNAVGIVGGKMTIVVDEKYDENENIVISVFDETLARIVSFTIPNIDEFRSPVSYNSESGYIVVKFDGRSSDEYAVYDSFGNPVTSYNSYIQTLTGGYGARIHFAGDLQLSSGTFFAVCTQSGMHKFDDTDWSLLSGNYPTSVFSHVISFYSGLSTHLMAARSSPTDYAQIVRSDDDGATWNTVFSMDVNETIFKLSYDQPKGTAYAATSDGLYHSIDDGLSWQRRGFDGLAVTDIWADNSMVLVYGPLIGLQMSDNEGYSFVPVGGYHNPLNIGNTIDKNSIGLYPPFIRSTSVTDRDATVTFAPMRTTRRVKDIVNVNGGEEFTDGVQTSFNFNVNSLYTNLKLSSVDSSNNRSENQWYSETTIVNLDMPISNLSYDVRRELSRVGYVFVSEDNGTTWYNVGKIKNPKVRFNKIVTEKDTGGRQKQTAVDVELEFILQQTSDTEISTLPDLIANATVTNGLQLFFTDTLESSPTKGVKIVGAFLTFEGELNFDGNESMLSFKATGSVPTSQLTNATGGVLTIDFTA